MRSWATTVRMSAHDIMPGHVSSNAIFIQDMASYASPRRDWSSRASRSAVLNALEEMRREASQPPTMQS
ncbi:hypothetical protein LguiA_000289 [Lonicera macranthoides]